MMEGEALPARSMLVYSARMDDPAESALSAFELAGVDKVVFYKRDEITTDLICCEVQVGDLRWFFHEEMPGWDAVIERLSSLDGFRRDWFAHVAQPTFAYSLFIAFER